MYGNNGYMQQPFIGNVNPNFYPQNQQQEMQQRLNQMQQIQNQFNQMQQQGIIKGRAVTSFEEANAAMIDLDGSVHVFTDFAHGKIYTKQIGLDGLPIFNVYVLSNEKMVTDEDKYQSLFFKVKQLEEKIEKIVPETHTQVRNQVQQQARKGGNKNE